MTLSFMISGTNTTIFPVLLNSASLLNRYGSLFNLIRNGRIDLAKEYFYTIIPEGYDTYSILPQSLNTREKLWKGYLRRLKESSSFIGLDSQGNALSPSVEHKKNVYWSVLEDLNGGLL